MTPVIIKMTLPEAIVTAQTLRAAPDNLQSAEDSDGFLVPVDRRILANLVDAAIADRATADEPANVGETKTIVPLVGPPPLATFEEPFGKTD